MRPRFVETPRPVVLLIGPDRKPENSFAVCLAQGDFLPAGAVNPPAVFLQERRLGDVISGIVRRENPDGFFGAAVLFGAVIAVKEDSPQPPGRFFDLKDRLHGKTAVKVGVGQLVFGARGSRRKK